MSDSNVPLIDLTSALDPIEIGSIISISETTTSSPTLGEAASHSGSYCSHNPHTRLDSIHLNSEPSGSWEHPLIANAADLFIHPFVDPGEGATELQNALNPPWNHGVLGTSNVHSDLADKVDPSTLETLKSPGKEVAPTKEKASSQLDSNVAPNSGNDQVLTPRPSVKDSSLGGNDLSPRQIVFDSSSLKSAPPKSRQSSSNSACIPSSPAREPSPFDIHEAKQEASHACQGAAHATSCDQAQDALSAKPVKGSTHQSSLCADVSAPAQPLDSPPLNDVRRAETGLEAPERLDTSHGAKTCIINPGGVSGEATSEDEDPWAMPVTPLIPDDRWDVNLPDPLISTSNPVPKPKAAGARDTPAAQTSSIRSEKITSLGATPLDKLRVVGGGRAPPRGLISNNGSKEGQRRLGRCKMYNCDKGIGFLIDDDLAQVPYDVKIHWTDLYSDKEFKSLAKGEVVEFTLNITSKGYSASYVTGPGGRPVMGAEQTIIQSSRQTSYKLFKAGALPIKTYRSKWDGVPDPAGFLQSPEVPLRPEQPRKHVKSTYTQSEAAMPASTTATPASVKPGLRVSTGKPTVSPMTEEHVITPASASATKIPVSIATPNMARAYPPITHPIPGQYLTHSPWSQYFSPQSFTGVRQLGKLAPLTTTQGTNANSVLAQYEKILTRGYAGQTKISPFPSLDKNPMRNGSALAVDMHSLLAERHLLLQHQAAMVAFLQKCPVPTVGYTQPALAPHRQLSTLLPPISLPASYTAAVNHARTNPSSWTSAPIFRPNAQVFSPALEPSPSRFPAQHSRPVFPITEPQVLQPPGRRSVSDPKPSEPGSKRSTVGNKLEVPEFSRGHKRVTFAQDNLRSRRVVSHGDAAEDGKRVAQRASVASPGYLSVSATMHPNLLSPSTA